MAKVHDKFVIELAEVIKGYGNDPDVDDPFHLSEFYRFYELPEIAVSANHFKTMIPLEVEKAKGRKTGKWIMKYKGSAVTSYKCSECGRTVKDDTGYDVSKDYPFCHCGADMRRREQDDSI